MAKQNGKTILVMGSTGKQGGAVARQLLSKKFIVKAMTRKPDSQAAKELEKLGAQIVDADLNDMNSVERALEGVWGVFSVLTMAETSPEWEEEHGMRFAEAADNAAVERFVYSSVASADKDTGIPHFESKWHIEEKVRDLDFPFYTIIRPASFMENVLNPMTWAGIEHGDLAMGLRPDEKMQMVAVEDIGKFGAMAFEWDNLNREEIDLAGDEKSVAEMAQILSGVLGKQIKPAPVNLAQIKRTMPDYAKMMEWMDKVGYSVVIPALTTKYGIQLVTFDQFAKKVKWPMTAS